jgi:tetratricopeptide (TPR) repeat protein
MEFMEASYQWDLTSLYSAIEGIKLKKLTDWQKTSLRGLLCGYPPEAIAGKLYWTVGSLRVELSKHVYPYISAITGEEKIIWNRIGLLLADAGYKYPELKVIERDLLKLELTSTHRQLAEEIQGNSFQRLPIGATKLLKELPVNPNREGSLSLGDRDRLKVAIDNGERAAKQGENLEALYRFQCAVKLDPTEPVFWIKIARCYDKLGAYKDCLFVCDRALHILEKKQNVSANDRNLLRTKIYNLLAGIFHELALTKPDIFYFKTAFTNYQLAAYFSPGDSLVAWNVLDLFLAASRHAASSEQERQDFADRALKALYDLRGSIHHPRSNFGKYRRKILDDAAKASTHLSPWWQTQLKTLGSGSIDP